MHFDINIFIYSFLFSCFIEFLDFCFQQGNIFDFYKKYLINKFYKGQEVSMLESDLYSYKEANIESKWYKVLIGCKYCYQFWLSIPFMFIFGINIVFLFIFVSLNFFYLKLFKKWLH